MTYRTDWTNAKPVPFPRTGTAPLWNCCANNERPEDFGTAASLEINPCLTVEAPIVDERGRVVDTETDTDPVYNIDALTDTEQAGVFWTVYMRHEGDGSPQQLYSLIDALGDFPTLNAARVAAKAMRLTHPRGQGLDVFEFGCETATER